MTRASTPVRPLPRHFGGSTLFNGTTSTIPTTLTSNDVFTTGNGFTMWRWIKPKKNTSIIRIFDKSTGTSGENGFLFSLTTLQRIQFSVNGIAGIVYSSEIVKKNQWQLALVTVAADATVTHYINGVASGTPGTTGTLAGITTANPLTIGNRSGATDRTFDGLMGEGGIVPRVLTQAEITALYIYGVLPSDTAHHWALDDQPSTYIDTIAGNNGTGTATTFSTDTPYKEPVSLPTRIPQVLRFDGVNDYVTVGDIPEVEFTGDFTFTAKAYVTNPTGNFRDFCSKWPSGFAFQLEDYSNQIVFNENGVIATSDSNISVGWHVITYVRSGAYRYFYVDGIYFWDGYDLSIPSFAGADDFVIGCLTGGSQYFNKGIAYVMAHSRALTPTEVYNLHLYNVVPTTGLVGHWNEISEDGTTLIDSVGGNNGAITGAVRETNISQLPYMPRGSLVPYVGSVKANGSSTSVIVTEASSIKLSGSVLTFDVLCKFDTVLRYESLGGKYDAGTDNGWLVEKLDTGALKILLKTSSGTNNFTSTRQFFVDTAWHRITVTYNGTHVTYYRDGVPFEQFDCTGTIVDADTKDLWLAVRPFGAVSLGNYASFRLYNACPSSAEVETLALHNTTPYDNDPTICKLNLEAKTDVMSGSTWIDVSGNGNHGTVSGATISSQKPSEERNRDPENLIYNGDFHVRPYTVAAQTTNGWNNGTATGVTGNTPPPFKWHAGRATGAGTFEALFEEDGMSLNVPTSNTGVVRLANTPIASAWSTAAAVNGTLLRSGNSYAITFKVKTIGITNTTGKGFFGQVSTGYASWSGFYAQSPYIRGTNDWTTVTLPFTVTGANPAYCHVSFGNETETGKFIVKDIRLTEL